MLPCNDLMFKITVNFMIVFNVKFLNSNKDETKYTL